MNVLFAVALLASAASFVNDPVVTLGDSVQSVTERLGTPDEVSYELLTSRQGPTHRDVRATLSYPGLQVRVYFQLCCGTSRIESVTMTDPAAAALLDIQLPATAAEVLEVLGPPSHDARGTLEYSVDDGRGIARLEFDEDRVRTVRWVYAVE